ncbi:hypothetical protein PGT21_027143 [Puccinia graminis f. sp. tritici]|uniref:Uncharacterized protein n=1 Tax=Puccinia graminis f. sp. tritici TaxID=56615 RepID=A0A5B0QPU2_PUCGR|nr:hypothetical protein PGT21_027143 [Puccinia graminis f. sp. tritici]
MVKWMFRHDDRASPGGLMRQKPPGNGKNRLNFFPKPIENQVKDLSTIHSLVWQMVNRVPLSLNSVHLKLPDSL